jgi:glycosyltransferase involved in cell wall biosynthesis
MWYDAGRFDGPLDAVHATAFPYTFPIACARRLARRRGVPFLLTPFLHLGDPTDPHDRTRRQYTQPVMRWLLREADHIFVQTEAESSAVEALGIPPQRITLQGLGVDADEVTGGNRVAARQAWGVTATDFVVGHLANASVEKGTVDLLRAAENSPVRVVLAGPSMPNFEQHWQRHPLGNVTRLGPISESQKRDFYAGMDAFGLPSRTDSFGLVLLEAWANAKPVVVYAAGGPGELVRSGVDGQVVPCGDVAGLRAILHRWAADAPLVRQLGEAGHRRVQQTFRWTDKLQRVRAVIQQLTAARLHNTTLDTTYGTTCNKLAGERNDSS